MQDNPRSVPLKAVAKANGLELDIVEVEQPPSADYHKLNHQGKIPTFQGADGYILSECIAIAIYRTYPTTFLKPCHPSTMMNYTIIKQLSLSETPC